MKTSHILRFGIVCFFIAISIGYLTTNNLSRLIIEPVRYVSAVGACISIGLLFLQKKITYKQITAILLYFLLIAWGMLLSFVTGSEMIGAQSLLTNGFVIIGGASLLSIFEGKMMGKSLAQVYVAYVFLGVVATIMVGGLDLSFPPSFVFEYSEDQKGSKFLYSQGISKFFGFGAISSILLAIGSKSKLGILIWTAIAAAFLLLSFLGGARGDCVFAGVVVTGCLAIKFKFRFLFFALVLGGGGLYYLADDWSWFDNFIIFQRLAVVAAGDFGEREALLAQAVNLIFNEPHCLAFGCGMGYFQAYYGYEFGMYPHNLFVESIITFGLPLTVLSTFLVLAGVRLYYRQHRSMDLFLLFFIYSALIGLKSGSLMGNWLFLISCLCFASMYIEKLVKYRVINEPFFVNQPSNIL